MEQSTQFLTLADADALAAPTVAVPVRPRQESRSLEPGTVVAGQYRIDRLLGRGGMGEVYLAYDGASNEPVAIKASRVRPSEEIADDQRPTRESAPGQANRDRAPEIGLRAERRALASIKSDAVVRVLSPMIEDHDQLMIAIEYVPGVPIDEFVQRNGLTQVDCGELIERVCRAYDDVHAAGLIHRDPKPANVLVASDGKVKLIDFGLALSRKDIRESTARTGFAGTPGYASTEAIAERFDLFSPKTDVYSIGVMAYELFTGCRPWPQDPERPHDAQSLLRTAIEVEPFPASTLNPRLPRRLAEVIAQAMAVNPVDRIKDALELGERIRESSAGFWSRSPQSIIKKSYEAASRRVGRVISRGASETIDEAAKILTGAGPAGASGDDIVPDLARTMARRMLSRKGARKPAATPTAPTHQELTSVRPAPSISRRLLTSLRLAPPQQGRQRYVDVYFVTDRRPARFTLIPFSTRPYFGSRRNKEGMHHGIARVSIPKGHRIGNLERPSIFRLELREDQEHHVCIESVAQLDNEEFFDRLLFAIDVAHGHCLVFVHGFNVTFVDAILSAARLSNDTEFRGPVVAYSWPSRGRTSAYSKDANTIVWTERHLRQFLSDLMTRLGARVVHLVAHSMGNQPLLRALEMLSAGPLLQGRSIGELICAAADVDADAFAQSAVDFVKTARRTTLYSSSMDRALVASKRFANGERRAGDSAPTPLVVPGIDTIDVSEIEAALLRLNHSYFLSAPPVAADIGLLLHEGKAPPRYRLEQQGQPPNHYWRLKP